RDDADVGDFAQPGDAGDEIFRRRRRCVPAEHRIELGRDGATGSYYADERLGHGTPVCKLGGSRIAATASVMSPPRRGFALSLQLNAAAPPTSVAVALSAPRTRRIRLPKSESANPRRRVKATAISGRT